jgi:hypothetical protein
VTPRQRACRAAHVERARQRARTEVAAELEGLRAVAKAARALSDELAEVGEWDAPILVFDRLERLRAAMGALDA